MTETDNTLNLTHMLSVCGAASRRKSAELIKNGSVKVNGELETNPGRRVSYADKIEVNGKKLQRVADHVYIMLNKPRGYVCTNEDPHAKKLAVDLIHLKKDLRLFSIGRLDKDSEGLIIFTNDGDFANRIMHPRNEILKSYALSAERPFTNDELQQMCDGIEDDGEELHAEDIYQMGERKYLFVLSEGKKREVRRLVEYFGNDTKRLERMAIGNLKRGMLKPGQWRFMTRKDMANILSVDEDSEEMADFPASVFQNQKKLATHSAPANFSKFHKKKEGTHAPKAN